MDLSTSYPQRSEWEKQKARFIGRTRLGKDAWWSKKMSTSEPNTCNVAKGFRPIALARWAMARACDEVIRKCLTGRVQTGSGEEDGACAVRVESC